jgi:cytochrome c oxidase subunit 2
MRIVPNDAMKVKAIGKMWTWEFEYEGDKVSDTLMLPIDKSVKIDLISTDVLHGFSVPAFRIKEDVVPVKNNYTWFKPGELGEFDLYCTVYCGLSHAYMHSIVKVVPQEQFASWLAKLPKRKKNEGGKGLKLLEKNGCLACHSIDGTKLVGPSFKGSYGSKIKVKTNGAVREVVFDDKYLETSVYDPNADISGDYPQGLMKSYKDAISKEDMVLINDYLKNLK